MQTEGEHCRISQKILIKNFYQMNQSLFELELNSYIEDDFQFIFQPCLDNFVSVIDNDEFVDLIRHHTKVLKDELGPTAAFWLSFLEMMDILFAFTRSVKLGNWELHLEATRRMIPWFFAYDRPNYSRFLTYYWMEMIQLPTTHPNIHQEFL